MPDWGEGFSAWWMTITNIPGIVLQHWPTWFAFAATDAASTMVLSMIPRIGGMPDLVIGSGVYGAKKAVDFATWDAFNGKTSEGVSVSGIAAYLG